MLSTSFTRLVGCTAPLQCAPLPFIGAPDLVVAVADAGGLAMLGAPLATPDALGALVGEIEARTKGTFGVNFLIPFLDRACVELAARKARVVEFFYGDPDPELVALGHRGGALVGWQIGSADEAIAAEKAGCDFIVAQGVQAGGHVRSLVEETSQILKRSRSA